MSCEACDAMIAEGAAAELHPACRAGRCTAPVEAGGLGVVRPHPWNAIALRVYAACCRLGPALALRLLDVRTLHPAPALLAEQLEILAEAWGAPWLGVAGGSGEA